MNRKTCMIFAALAAAGLTLPATAQEYEGEWYGGGWQETNTDYQYNQTQRSQDDFNQRQRPGLPYYNEAEGSRAGSMMYGTDVSENYEPSYNWPGGDQQQQRYGQQQRQQRYGQQQSAQRQKQISGQLESYRTVSLQGEDEDHVIARVRTQDGRTAVLDLGEVGDLEVQRTRLSEGMRISASGETGRINDRPVIVVDNVDIQGQRPRTSFRRDRDQQRQQQSSWQQDQQRQNRQQAGQQQREQGQWQQYATPRQQRDQQQQRSSQQYDWQRQQLGQQQGQQRNQQQGQQRSQQQGQQQQGLSRVRGAQGFDAQNQLAYIQGRITDMTDVSLQGVPDEHRLVKVQIGQNQTVVADLGTRQQFDQLNLQTGDTVFVYGNPIRINGRPVLLASHVAELKGDIIKIDPQNRATRQSLNTQRSR